MKTSIKSLIVLAMIFALPFCCEAKEPQWYKNPATSPMKLKSWNQLKDLILEVAAYGLYDNGSLKNMTTPGDHGFKETGTLQNKDGKLYWHKVVSGSRTMDIWFNARVDGYTLYTDSTKEDIKWIKITQVADAGAMYIIMTYDNRNTWRWFSINRTGYYIMNHDI